MCREELDSWALLSSRFALFSKLYHSCPHYHGVVLLKQLWGVHHNTHPSTILIQQARQLPLQWRKENHQNVLYETGVFSQHGACPNPACIYTEEPCLRLQRHGSVGEKAFLQLRAAWKRRWVSFCSRLFNSFRLREASVSSPLHLSLKLESIKGLSGACWEFQCSAKDASGSLSWLEITWPQAALSLSGGRWETGN